MARNEQQGEHRHADRKLTSAILLLAAIAPAQSQTAIPGVIAAGTRAYCLGLHERCVSG
jgi:hypothetical protein